MLGQIYIWPCERENPNRTSKKPKSLCDIVSEAQAIETAQRVNRIITNTNSTEEQVNFTSSSSIGGPPPHKKHHDMKLKLQAGTCYWCGDSKGLNPWWDCPAQGSGPLFFGIASIADDMLIYGKGETDEEADVNHDIHLVQLIEM